MKIATVEAVPLRMPFDFSGKARDASAGGWPALDFCLVKVTTDTGITGWGDAFAYRFVGAIEIPADGAWTSSSSSDDGSRVIVDGVVLVDNDGLHGPISVGGGATLSAGLHAFEVQYFEAAGGEILDVSWEGPGVAAQAIPSEALFTAP